MAGATVSNSSPLIAFSQIEHMGLLRDLFGSLLIPTAVAREVAPTVAIPPWISERPLAQAMSAEVLRASLGPGESEAIALASELKSSWLLLDERPARRLAQALGLRVIGTLGILLAAKRRGLVAEVRPRLDQLVDFGFRVAPPLYARVLADAGE